MRMVFQFFFFFFTLWFIPASLTLSPAHWFPLFVLNKDKRVQVCSYLRVFTLALPSGKNAVLPDGSVVKNLLGNAGNAALISGSEKSPGEGNGNPLQYSCLGSPMDRGALWATVRGVAKSQTWLKWLSMDACSITDVVWKDLTCAWYGYKFPQIQIFNKDFWLLLLAANTIS